MALTNIPLGEITEGHLRRLIAAQAAESLHVEYKRETYGSNDDQRREFLADVSSFANAAGGDLVIGIAAAKGIPTAIHPFMGNEDEERLRLEQMARDGLSPRISNLQTRAVPLSEGGCVVVLRVPKSYIPPHRVTFKNTGRFWARSSAGKYEPNVEELRRIFTEAPLLAERARAFRIERTARIAAHETPVSLKDGGILVLHVVPFAAFDFGQSLSLDEVSAHPERFAPIRGTARDFIKYSRHYTMSLQMCGSDPPFAIMVSLVDVKGKILVQDSVENAILEDLPSMTLNRDQFHFVETIFQNVPENDQDAAKQLKATLDHLANAAGLPSTRTLGF
jgi:hypothetical protein